MSINRRKLLINSAASIGAGISGATILGAFPAFAEHTPATQGGASAPRAQQGGKTYDVEKLNAPDGPADHIIGNPNSKVSVIEYASSTCGFCARFHTDVYPEFKAAYIDTNKIKFTLRPFVLNVLDAVVFMLAYKAGETSTAGYYAILDAYLKNQTTWSQAQNPRAEILKIAKQFGFSEKSFDEVLTNKELFEQIERLREQASKKFDMSGTPSFYINGKQFVGIQTFETLAEEIDKQLS